MWFANVTKPHECSPEHRNLCDQQPLAEKSFVQLLLKNPQNSKTGLNKKFPRQLAR